MRCTGNAVVSGVFAVACLWGCGSSNGSTTTGEDAGANDSSIAQGDSSTMLDARSSTEDTGSSAADTGSEGDTGSSAGDGAAPQDAGEADAAAQDAALDGGSGGDTGIQDASGDAADGGCASTVYVSVGTGLDTNAGTQAAPFKTITRAIAVAGADTCIATIQVAAGTYTVASGEVFPLAPSHVAVIGDETNKGNASGAAVEVEGCGLAGPASATYCAAFAPGVNATLAGLKIVASSGVVPDGGQGYGNGVYWANAGGIVRNNTITQCSYMGVQFVNGAGGVLSGNAITANVGSSFGGFGVAFNGGGAKVEDNVITNNDIGVFGYAGVDLGGGALGSAGGNVLSCNTRSDLFAEIKSLAAQNNAWDHVSPTESSANTGGGVDVTYVSGVAPITTGATLAPLPCP
jgi:hypothetical protein